jgi:aminotransferase
MKISKRANVIEASLTRKLFNMAAGLDHVIDLTLGDPDLLPPENVRTAGCQAIMQGKTRYSANAGLIVLRKQYAAFVTHEFGISVDPGEQIIVTVGGMEGLFLALSSLIDEGDEVIVLGPYYVNYMQMIRMCNGTALVADVYGMNDEERLHAIARVLTDKTKGMIINNPCNPSGEVLSAKFLEQVAQLVVQHNLFIVSDEVYSSLIFDGKKHTSLLCFPGMMERAVLIDSCSKRFSMTGWRVGFAIGPKEVIASMTKMQENVAACAPLPSQYAALEAYSERTNRSYILETFQRRRDTLFTGLSVCPNISCRKPEATFYAFVDISRTGYTSEAFAYELLQEEHVAVVPGKAYGSNYDGFIRIAFTVDEEVLKEACIRIRRFLESRETSGK